MPARIQPTRLSPDSLPEAWRGAIDWENDGQWWQPWRLLPELAPTAHAPDLILKARMAAGVRAEVITDASRIEITIDASEDVTRPIDVVVDGALHYRKELPLGLTEVDVQLPAGTKRVDLWLPQTGVLKFTAPLLHDATRTEPAPQSDFRWTTYGSSITHCTAADGPSETWPALVARERGWDLTCLGFGGQCHLDPIAAKTIAARPADLISLCLGINMYEPASFGPRSFAGQVSGFVQSVREAHPETPIAVITPIVSPAREETANDVGMTLADMRRDVVAAARILQQAGDSKLFLIDGLSIIAPGDEALLFDGLHPDAAGYRVMAERLGPQFDAIV